MGTAVRGVHVVGKGQDQLVEAVVVLHGHLGDDVVLLALQVDDLGMQHGVVPLFLQVFHEAGDAALVVHAFPHHLVAPFVGKGDTHARVQEGFLPQADQQSFIVIDGGLGEHNRVRLEAHGGAGGGSGAQLFQRCIGHATLEPLVVFIAILADDDLQPLTQGVYHAGAHAVQAAGHLVAGVFAAELAAGVQHGENNGHGGDAQLGLDVHGDAAAVIGDLDHVALLDSDLDMIAEARQRLVDGVVHDLVDQMVQALGAGGADVHARPFAHRFQPFQHLDLAAVVLVGALLRLLVQFFCHCLASCCFWAEFTARCAPCALVPYRLKKAPSHAAQLIQPAAAFFQCFGRDGADEYRFVREIGDHKAFGKLVAQSHHRALGFRVAQKRPRMLGDRGGFNIKNPDDIPCMDHIVLP